MCIPFCDQFSYRCLNLPSQVSLCSIGGSINIDLSDEAGGVAAAAFSLSPFGSDAQWL